MFSGQAPDSAVRFLDRVVGDVGGFVAAPRFQHVVYEAVLFGIVGAEPVVAVGVFLQRFDVRLLKRL